MFSLSTRITNGWAKPPSRSDQGATKERPRSDQGATKERPSLLDLLSEFGLISDGWLGSISPLEIGPMHLSVEGLRP